MGRSPDTRCSPVSARVRLAVLVVGVGAIAYANSLTGPFIFDDVASIPDNPNIRALWPVWRAMAAPPETTIVARPVVSLSLALNHAIDGLNVRGYHLFNVAVHLICGLLLMGIIDRTLRSAPLAGRFDSAAPYLAAASAALWVVHPLQTEAVTYVIQRTELIMAMFYLLALYGAIRAFGSRRPRLWLVAAIGSCALGMGSKEVMVSAPLVVLLYDRTFVSGTLRSALKAHGGLYAGLAGTWLVLAAALRWSPPRATAGFGLGITSLEYLQTEAGVILWYLRLCFQPGPLSISYDDWPIARRLIDVWPQVLAAGSLLAVTLWAVWRRPAAGFTGAWFFLILAPTSSVLPMALEIAGERRMYLPLAAVVVLTVVGAYMLLEGLRRRFPGSAHASGRIGAGLAAIAVILLAGRTVLRNRDYRSAVAIWTDAVAQRPGNALARCSLGTALIDSGRPDEAAPHLIEALRLRPDAPEAHNGLGIVLAGRNHFSEAAARFTRALELKENYPYAHTNLGKVLAEQGFPERAVGHHRRALEIKPDLAEAHVNLAGALARLGQPEEAILHAKEAVRLKPAFSEAHGTLGVLLAEADRLAEAIDHYREALRLKPRDAQAKNNLGAALYRLGQPQEALVHFEAAVRLEPDFAEAHNNLAGVLFARGEADRAIAHWRKALDIKPDFAAARAYLDMALSHRAEGGSTRPSP